MLEKDRDQLYRSCEKLRSIIYIKEETKISYIRTPREKYKKVTGLVMYWNGIIEHATKRQ